MSAPTTSPPTSGAAVEHDVDDVDDVVARACLSKSRYHTRRFAERIAQRARAQGEHVNVYRCPFAARGDGHYHVGHPPGVDSMRVLADAIRRRPAT